MKQKLFTFISTLALWFVLAGRVTIEVFLLGAILCSCISLMLADRLFSSAHMKYGVKEFFMKLPYILLVFLAFIYDVFLSALRVSKHAFERKPSFSPRVVRIKSSLTHSTSTVLLANFITLPKGTLVIDFDPSDKNFLIHWIDVQSDEKAEVKKAFIKKHENLINKLFD
ncbi:Na+/H+ antiporter subunit E [Bacillus weihaiensis]|uniref:Na+/H+ antiporter subunit E n=1 Tax=Bacillus weihaiensis TaxID=1547283 RepID=UPI002354AA1E|nr:Na+/H+ antiporter subunit E [Bacillus weihaiensis]